MNGANYLFSLAHASLSGEGYLLCMAQIGLSLAGFAGLIGSFKPDRNNWMLQEVAGIVFIIHHTLLTVFVSLVPFIAMSYEASESLAWKISGVILAVTLLCETVWQCSEVVRLSKAKYPPRHPYVLYATLTTSCIVVIGIGLGLYYGRVELVYKVGLLWLLVAAGFQFLIFVQHFAEMTKAPTT